MIHTTDERATLLYEWINQQYGIVENSFSVVSGDASFRRYFRFVAKYAYEQKNISLIAVDAPPELENSQPFIDIADLLAKSELPVPKIHQYDLIKGFYIQEDFGDRLLLDHLNETSADVLYKHAISQICGMQDVNTDSLPLYDAHLLQKEMHLFTDWFIDRHLKISLSEDDKTIIEHCFQLLENNALDQPQVFVHRDYHSRNLMLLEDNKLGIIDFQDAVKGPITYDLVSLLRDCYITWPQSKIDRWLEFSHRQLDATFSLEQLTRWFDLMGIQRHLKAVGIFCRLNYRDGKSEYLNDIPRTLNYIKQVCKNYPELREFNRLIKKL